MSSRAQILADVKKNQPELIALPDLPAFQVWFDDAEAKFKEVLTMIGGHVFSWPGLEAAEAAINENYPQAKRIISNIPGLQTFTEGIAGLSDPHTLENVDVAILQGQLGVAENGAIWVTEINITERVLPFICQSLVLVIYRSSIVPTMHEAYSKIADSNYGYGSFIAGPSKTADIEQSLVLGAHGPKNMSVFLLD